jgi:hypothetical protein
VTSALWEWGASSTTHPLLRYNVQQPPYLYIHTAPAIPILNRLTDTPNMAPLEEMHTAMVNRSIRTIKAVCLTWINQATAGATSNIQIPGARIPHRCRYHHTADPLGPPPAHAAADSPPCSHLRRRRSDASVPGWYYSAPTYHGLEQHEPTQRLRPAEQRL